MDQKTKQAIMMENGKTICQMVMECTNMVVDMDTRAIGNRAKNMVKVNNTAKAIVILENGKKTNSQNLEMLTIN